MATLEELLAPISDDRATGPDLRMVDGDVTFDRLRDLVSPPNAGEEGEAEEPDWSGAVTLCESALQSQSKDLELITQLCAAWVRVDGAAGLTRGLELIRRSLDSFWKEIHPGFDPDDGEITLALRARWLNWMDSPRGLLLAVRQAPLFDAGGRTCSWSDYENSAVYDDPSTSAERREELAANGVLSPAEWEGAFGAISHEDRAEIASAMGEALESARAIAAFCREPFEAEDEDPPDLYHLSELLEAIQTCFDSGSSGTSVTEGFDSDDSSEATTSDSGAQGGATSAAPARGLQTRADALRQLEEVGAYFRRTEPHSPISYLISRAVKWGSMPLDRLLKDVVRDDGVIEHIWETLGLDSPTGDDERDDEDED